MDGQQQPWPRQKTTDRNGLNLMTWNNTILSNELNICRVNIWRKGRDGVEWDESEFESNKWSIWNVSAYEMNVWQVISVKWDDEH